MLNKTLTTGALVLSALLPFAATGLTFGAAVRTAVADDTSRVWVEGHYETRESSELVPAQTRREWVPPRFERVPVPAVTDRVWIPPLTERVRLPAVTERVWVPEETERYWQRGYFDLAGWHPAHWDNRVIRRGHYEDRLVAEGGFEERVVREGQWMDRIVTPARTESRVVEDGYWRDVVVRPERTQVTRKKVWVPGHYEDR